jgi:hypothetical protein
MMRKLLPLLLCLSLSISTLARAIKPEHVFASETDAKTSISDVNTEEEETSDDEDSREGAPNDEGEDMNDPDGIDAAGDQDAGDNDEVDDGGGDEED